MKSTNITIDKSKKQAANWLRAFLSILVPLTLSASPLAAQQTFDSGSDGSNGALNLTLAEADGNGVILFDSQARGLVPDENNAYHFTTINVESGVTVKLRADVLGSGPVIWLASGDVSIDGTLDLDGENGHNYNQPAQAAVAGAGGFAGGVGCTVFNPAFAGFGPGGGNAPINRDWWGSGAGHLTRGSDVGASFGGGALASIGGDRYGNNFLIPLLGGSGGSGGGESSPAPAGDSGRLGGGGGAGGGAILIASSTQIQVNGSISCDGGNGGAGGSLRAGGGGSGGSIRLMANTLAGSGSLSTTGGSGASSAGPGSFGRIRNESFNHQFAGTTVPNPISVTPGLVFPASGPSVRVVRLSGLSVPPNASTSIDIPLSPTGSFNPADLVIDEDAIITFEIEASNIPVGTVVELSLLNETQGVLNFSSTPLAGTEANSTATATTSIPHGFSRFTIEANWDPGS